MYLSFLDNLCSASYVSCQHDTARICCRAPAPDVDQWDRQTNEQRNKQMLDCFTGPVPDGGGVGEASDEALQPRSS